MKSEQLAGFTIHGDATIVEAMQRIDINARGILFVVDDKNRLLGVVTDGDIRRWLIKTGNMQSQIKGIMNQNPRLIYRKDCDGT